MIDTDKKLERPFPHADARVAGITVASSMPRREIMVRRRQRVPAAVLRAHALHALEAGCISIGALLPGGRRQILAMLYPGDVLSAEMTPPGPDIALVALLPTRLIELPPAAPRVDDQGRAAEAATASVTRQLARASLHSMTLGRLTGEERVASVLVELAHALGQPVPGGYIFELPMSRQDLADYLAINPDTLSRMISRLKAQGILSSPGRRTMIIKDFVALTALTPLADALEQLHG